MSSGMFLKFPKFEYNVVKGRALEERGSKTAGQYSSITFQAQDQCIAMSKKSSKGGRRPLWMSRELLENLKQILGCGKELAVWEE